VRTPASELIRRKRDGELLRGDRRDARLHAVTAALAAEMLVLGGLARDRREAATAVDRALASGTAAERFARMVATLGGPTDLVERPERHLPRAPVRLAVTPARPGFVASVAARALGTLVVALGGGRQHADDEIDPAVGLTEVAGVEDEVGDGRPLAIVHARSETGAIAAATTLREAIVVGDGPRAAAPSPVLRKFGALG
jgi:thymidine phosphorylase